MEIQKVTEDAHQKLMNNAYDLINRDGEIKSHSDMIKYLSDNKKYDMLDAVLIGNMNYQVENGGWEQWVSNGYCIHFPLLVDALNRVDSPNTIKVLDMLDTVAKRLSDDVLDGSIHSGGCMDNYLNEEYQEHEEECSECGGNGYIDTEDGEEDCEWCDGCGFITIEEDLDYGDLSSLYYKFNDEFMTELKEYFEK